jgi:hypothetical protein
MAQIFASSTVSMAPLLNASESIFRGEDDKRHTPKFMKLKNQQIPQGRGFRRPRNNLPDPFCLLLFPCVRNRNFHLNWNFRKINFPRLDHCISQDGGGIIRHVPRNFKNDFVMHRSNNSSSGIHQPLWEQASAFLVMSAAVP